MSGRNCRWQAAGMALAFATLTTGCASKASEEPPPAKPVTVEERRAIVERETAPKPTKRPPAQASEAQTKGEVPQAIIDTFKEDASRRALVKPGTITVVSATEEQWPNGGMGCPEPGMMYTQIVIPGYRVVLKAGSSQFDYHSDLSGKFIVCDNGKSLSPAKYQIKQPAPAQ